MLPPKLGVSENLAREISALLTGRSTMDGWAMLRAARAIVWLLEGHKERQLNFDDYQKQIDDTEEASRMDLH